MIFLAKCRDQLIHNAAVTADKLVFSFLAIQGNLRAVERQMIELLEYRTHSDFQ